MWQGKKVIVVFPAYNEERGIVQAIEDFLGARFAQSEDLVDEVIAVDNNSRDRTAELIQSTRARYVRETRQGYGNALRRGMAEAAAAGADLIILAEPDGTFAGKDVVRLLTFADDFDLVLGTRTTRELIWQEANMGRFLRWGNWAVAKLLQVLFGGPSLSDCGCTLRLIHRQTYLDIAGRLTVGASHFLPEMVCLALLGGHRLVEVPVNYRGRVGESKITGSVHQAVTVGLRMIALILRYRLMSGAPRRERRPRRLSATAAP
ncbi:MAG: Glycosyltransferase [uncultured Chloroflexi bacterium]|uniref:Glycosyltransferase n=1 Tax=uncultured Chloroflexota bacterium TaxID=166587 RepID=A0A6J4JQK6_9CHLR|nr:MAG: Glycosyltransferase [uncultured Chloroflexota bacterium]